MVAPSQSSSLAARALPFSRSAIHSHSNSCSLLFDAGTIQFDLGLAANDHGDNHCPSGSVSRLTTSLRGGRRRFRLPRLDVALRRFLRQQQPRPRPQQWSWTRTVAVLLAACLVATLSSWPLLRQPVIAVGAIAEQDYLAPRAASVIDRAALEARRRELGSRTLVQVVDPQQTRLLRETLAQWLTELAHSVSQNDDGGGVPPIQLTQAEQASQQQLQGEDRQLWEDAVRSAQQRMLQQGVLASLSEADLQQASRMQLSALCDGAPAPDDCVLQQQVGARLLLRSLRGKTNLRTDPNLTRSLVDELLRQNVETIEVQAGSPIVSRGQQITARQFEVLDHFGQVGRRPALAAWSLRFGEALFGAILLVLVARRWRPELQMRHGLFLLLTLALVQALKLWLGASFSPLAVLVPATFLLAGGMGTAAALAWLAMATLLWPLPMDELAILRLLVAGLIAGIAALISTRQRSRAQLLLTAMVLTLVALLLQAVLLELAEQLGVTTGLRGGEFLGESILMGGLLLLALTLAPALENACGLLTRSRLLELADLQRPLLRRLAREAPGTFEHTLMICSLAEAGAEAIGADVDLVRTGSLYHDIGKLHAPEWFIENQAGSVNPHEKLDDPWASARVLQAHVDEGLKMAHRYRLPDQVRDFIPEHQGTMRMQYFWTAARQRQADVAEVDFRYRGPAPRSRETAIQMLADGCEAALRSLPPETSDAEAGAMVHRIFAGRLADGQLRQSGLSRGELALVNDAFVEVWKRMRHRRIPYPIERRR